MTDGLSRRNLIALAGAATVLPSCAAGLSHKRSPFDKSRTRGYDDNWGADPQHSPDEYSGITNVPPYNPQYIAISIIDFLPQWVIDVHHASFPLYPEEGDDLERYRLNLAKDLISWVITQPNRRLGHLSNSSVNPFNKRDHIPHLRTKGQHAGQHHVPSLKEFRFKSQNEIFIFLRSNNIFVNPARLLRVTKRSDTMARIMDLNCSLFNGRIVDDPTELGSLQNKGKLIRLENYVANCDGTNSTAETYYSLNIHFRMKVKPEVGPQQFVSMVIDPDTGNGAGNEP